MNTLSIQYWGKLALVLVIILTGLPAVILHGYIDLIIMFGLWPSVIVVSMPTLIWKSPDIIRAVATFRG